MGAMNELKAGPSKQQLERQHALRNQLKEDLEAQIEEKRMKDKKYRDEQRKREEMEEEAARKYQEHLDKLRAASPDTRARQKAREISADADRPDLETPAAYHNKEESIVGFSARPPKKNAVSNKRDEGREHATDGPAFSNYPDEDYGPVAAAVHVHALPPEEAVRASFGHTAIRRDVAELKEQQQQLIRDVHELAQAASASSLSDRESLEKLKLELREKQTQVDHEAERVRREAKEEIEKVRAEAARLARDEMVNRSLQGASVLVGVGDSDVFLVSEDLLPKDTNFIPNKEEVRNIRIDPNELPSYRLSQMEAASPSPDSALLHERQMETREDHEVDGPRSHVDGSISKMIDAPAGDAGSAIKPSKIPPPPASTKPRKPKSYTSSRPGEKLQRTQRTTQRVSLPPPPASRSRRLWQK